MARAIKNIRATLRPVRRTLQQSLRGILDRRTSFRDVSTMPAARRRPSSPVIQFYSAAHNIGNYTPVLGIYDMLGQTLDTWNVHRRPVDFDFLNGHYKGVIIGGAGLLDPCFESFWEELAAKCRLPMVIWGVGGCWPHDRPVSPRMREVAAQVGRRCDLINVRDTLTAEYFDLPSADIAPCPTVVWLKSFRDRVKARRVLVADHTKLVPAEQLRQIVDIVKQTAPDAMWTDNYQRYDFGLRDVIEQRYLPATRVVTTRLHGAIIANGLGIPYIAMAWDDKVGAYHEQWGGGMLVEPQDIPAALATEPGAVDADRLVALAQQFGERGKAWLQSLG